MPSVLSTDNLLVRSNRALKVGRGMCDNPNDYGIRRSSAATTCCAWRAAWRRGHTSQASSSWRVRSLFESPESRAVPETPRCDSERGAKERPLDVCRLEPVLLPTESAQKQQTHRRQTGFFLQIHNLKHIMLPSWADGRIGSRCHASAQGTTRDDGQHHSANSTET